MKITKNILFIFMLLTYFYAIYNVCCYYEKSNKSISSIIKDENCNQSVFISMIIMGLLTLIYEITRHDAFSFFCIIFLLIGIYGVLLYDHYNQLHFVFCFIVFISILFFMYNHCLKKEWILLFALLYIQEILSAIILLQSEIMNCEIYLLVNFAIFYIILHFY